MKRVSVDDRLAATRFDSNDEHSHIVIDRAACRTCAHQACTRACPAARYRTGDSGELLFDHVGCLECGNCRLVCERLYQSQPGYSWAYPHNGQGVIYRQG